MYCRWQAYIVHVYHTFAVLSVPDSMTPAYYDPLFAPSPLRFPLPPPPFQPLYLQLWLSMLMFAVGFLADGGIAVSGLVAMEVVPSNLAGSAHGLACAIAQGVCVCVCVWL